MNKFLSGSKLFLERHSSTILTCIGAVGVAATAILAVKATPKAMDIIKEVEEDKGEKLTKMEIVKVAGPCYIPSIAVGASTIACIFGANILNKRNQASLISAYALLDNSYKEYKNKVKELYGEDSERNIKQTLVKNKYEGYEHKDYNDKQLFFDNYSMQFFESTLEDVLAGEKAINDIFKMYGYAKLSDLYICWGLDVTTSDYALGWSMATGNYAYPNKEIDFVHESVIQEGGTECIIISMPNEPAADYLY